MQRLAQLWYRPARLAYLLLPLALLYRAATALRIGLYRIGVLQRARLQVPVVIVGNITAGGTGKTPLTQWIVQRLQANDRMPAVVSRSYAAQATSPARVRANDDPGVRGDEAVLLAATLTCPVWSGPDRCDTARALLQSHPEVDTLVCDDGLQHYALARDVEIVVIDTARGFGNRLPLPAGPLREPLSRLATVDAIVMNGAVRLPELPAAMPAFTMRLQGGRLRNVADPARVAGAEDFKGMRLAAMAGIGNPERFFSDLRALGLAFDAYAFPDHHRFRAEELRFPEADAILMTEKDAIKCASFSDARMWAVPVVAMVSGDLASLILERIGGRAARAPGAEYTGT